MKNLLLVALLATAYTASAQNIGINTNVPGSTLHVVGQPAITTVADGITVPSLSGDQLKAKDATYIAAQTGTTPIAIKVQVRRSPGDDYINFNGTNGTLIIQEIAR
ncbi:MAG: hypothetical protein KF862_27350 [Chitinophagaceae bacterium]|nr:hypothetical protein [Chitinophagaceae bacterium]